MDSEYNFDDFAFLKSMYAYAIGTEVIRYIMSMQLETLLVQIESEALDLLIQLKAVLDAEDTDDVECFRRIEAMISAFENHGIPIQRHDW